jgi:uncharacterized protein (TIGR00156 family)
MKTKLKMLVMLSMISIPTIVSAQFTGETSNGTVTTVEEFKKQVDIGSSTGLLDAALRIEKMDDKDFIMEGNIVGGADDNLYEFKDSTGTLMVKITDFDGIKVGPETRVRLFGEADYDDGILFLEVDKLELVK